MKIITTLLAALLLSAGLAIAVPTPVSAIPGGCVTLGEARETLEHETQSRASVNRGFGSEGQRVDGSRSAVWIDYLTCVRPNDPDLYMHVVYVREGDRWRTLYWNYRLMRGHGLNRTTGEDSWSGHR